MQGSDQAATELIAVLATTIVGERVFAPTFGIQDPVAGTGIAPSELAAKVAQFGPPNVTITGVNISWASEHTMNAQILFQDTTSTQD